MKTFLKNPTVLASLLSILLFVAFYFLLNDSGRHQYNNPRCSLLEERSDINQSLKLATACHYRIVSTEALFYSMLIFIFITTATYQFFRNKKDLKFLFLSFFSLFFWRLTWSMIISFSGFSVLYSLGFGKGLYIDSTPNFLLPFSFPSGLGIFWIPLLLVLLLSSILGLSLGVITRWIFDKIILKVNKEKNIIQY